MSGMVMMDGWCWRCRVTAQGSQSAEVVFGWLGGGGGGGAGFGDLGPDGRVGSGKLVTTWMSYVRGWALGTGHWAVDAGRAEM